MPKDEPMDNDQEVVQGFIFWDENPWNFLLQLSLKRARTWRFSSALD